PMYYDRDDDGLPIRWVERMRNALRVAGRRFTADRMVQEYVTRCYLPAMRNDPFEDVPPRG
ncbi:MAG: hypothetical protein AAB075_08310, partial [Gemmatimonadota bacterium]